MESSEIDSEEEVEDGNFQEIENPCEEDNKETQDATDPNPTEILENIERIKDPEEKIAALKALVVSYEYSGPIPSPAYFEAYERTLPGAADRILTMAEKTQENRIECDKQNNKKDLKALAIQEKSVEYSKIDNDHGFNLAKIITFIGGFLILVFIISGVVLLLLNKDIAGYISIGVGVIPVLFGIYTVFMKNQKHYSLGNEVKEISEDESEE